MLLCILGVAKTKPDEVADSGPSIWNRIHAIAYWFIWTNSKRMVELRWKYFRSSDYQNSLASRSIMMTQVSKKNQSDERLATLVASLGIPWVFVLLLSLQSSAVRELTGPHSRPQLSHHRCAHRSQGRRDARPDRHALRQSQAV